jgi:hypothetical protein
MNSRQQNDIIEKFKDDIIRVNAHINHITLLSERVHGDSEKKNEVIRQFNALGSDMRDMMGIAAVHADILEDYLPECKAITISFKKLGKKLAEMNQELPADVPAEVKFLVCDPPSDLPSDIQTNVSRSSSPVFFNVEKKPATSQVQLNIIKNDMRYGLLPLFIQRAAAEHPSYHQFTEFVVSVMALPKIEHYLTLIQVKLSLNKLSSSEIQNFKKQKENIETMLDAFLVKTPVDMQVMEKIKVDIDDLKNQLAKRSHELSDDSNQVNVTRPNTP